MRRHDEPLVSVVTPVYNGEKFLSECVESVLAQTYKNWEYIIVNNCSLDSSDQIAQDYAEKDGRIRIHNNDHFLNIIENWNHALRQICPESKYCKVVHCDDFLFPRCLEEMVSVAEQNESVGIVGSYILKGNNVKCDGLSRTEVILNGHDVCRGHLRKDFYLFGSPTSLLIRSDIVRGRESFYNELFLHADTEVCYDILQNNDFGFVHQVLSGTRLHDNSVTERFSMRNCTGPLDNLGMLVKYGSIYLEQNEYDRMLRARLTNYCKLLTKCLLHMRGNEFWRYHITTFRRLHIPINKAIVLYAPWLVAIDYLFNPKNTLERLIRWLKRTYAGRR